MPRRLDGLREDGARAAVLCFLLITVGILVLLGVVMRRSGVSLEPIVFLAGFLAIVALPQSPVRLANARLGRATVPSLAHRMTRGHRAP